MDEQQETIDTSNLIIGESMKYKELCELLNQPTYGGGQKVNQLKDFERYFSFEKDKTRYIITDIYEKPLPKEYKYPINTIYTELIENILLQYLSKQPGYKTYIAPVQLWYQLGMINGFFIKYKNDVDQELKSINPSLTSFDINDFYKRCRSKFSNIISTSFKSLNDRRLIEYHYVYRKGIYHNGEIIFEDVTEQEEKQIIAIERQVLLELGLDSIKQIGYSKLSKDFYKRTSKIFKEKFGWDGVYKFYKIIYNQEDVIDAISNEELNDKKKSLNKRIIDALTKNAEYNYEKSGVYSDDIQELMLDNDGILPSGIFFYPEKYLEKQKWLTDTLIKIKEK